MNILFVCTSNKDRSRTAEFHFQLKHPEHSFRSVGINRYHTYNAGGLHVSAYNLTWANRIICMEPVHLEYLSKNFGQLASKAEVLHLGNTEAFMSPSLIEKLEAAFTI